MASSNRFSSAYRGYRSARQGRVSPVAVIEFGVGRCVRTDHLPEQAAVKLRLRSCLWLAVRPDKFRRIPDGDDFLRQRAQCLVFHNPALEFKDEMLVFFDCGESGEQCGKLREPVDIDFIFGHVVPPSISPKNYTNVHPVIGAPLFFLSVDGCSKKTMSPGWLIPVPAGKVFCTLISPASESLGAFVGFFIVGFARIAARVVHASL